ncbi:hypothetical protein JTB14_036113 [Gonioctena quinquepunctata]|nr:hypothetical protein JTB14_036113 [Gonioctena quinquepunctata]
MQAYLENIECYENRVNNLIAVTKSNYYKEKIAKNKDCPQNMWKCVKQGIKSDNSIREFHSENVITKDKLQMAETFINYFIGVGENLAEKKREGCSMEEIACGHYLGHSTVSVIIKETTKALREVLAPIALEVSSTGNYLSEGCLMKEIACGHYLGHSTVSVIIKETTKALREVLALIALEVLSTEEWEAIVKGFYERWNLPNCIGAEDGKHVNIQAPDRSGSL